LFFFSVAPVVKKQMTTVATLDTPTLIDLLAVRLQSCRKQQLLALADEASIVLQSPNETCSQIVRRLLALEPDALRVIVRKLYGDPILNYNVHRCCICNEFMGRQMNDLGCSDGEQQHWAHWGCIADSGKEQCPLCRKSIQVLGSKLRLQSSQLMAKLEKNLSQL
jgi:hypothetical protein